MERAKNAKCRQHARWFDGGNEGAGGDGEGVGSNNA